MGDVITTTVERMTYANKKSIRQSEFYQAQATGLSPELAFEVRSMEYENEQLLKYDKTTYRVMRTYNKGEHTELICEGIVNQDSMEQDNADYIDGIEKVMIASSKEVFNNGNA